MKINLLHHGVSSVSSFFFLCSLKNHEFKGVLEFGLLCSDVSSGQNGGSLTETVATHAGVPSESVMIDVRQQSG